MTSVLVNRHHPDLYWSFHLMAKRLGWDLYIPAGMEWFDEGYFMMHEYPEKKDPKRYMAEWFLVHDLWGNKTKHTMKGCTDYPLVKPLTLQEFKDTDMDMIICTNRENEVPFYGLKELKPNLKFVRHVGNRFDVVEKRMYPNCLFSDKESYESNDLPNKILYHQEFDLNLFKYEPIHYTDVIHSFQHHLERYEPAEDLWRQHIRQFPEYSFKSYGKGNDDGYVYGKDRYISLMQMASFVWQVKDWDGYSHVIHNAMAIGRPMIVRRSDIKGKIYEPMLTEKTCVFTDQIERIRTVDIPQMSKNCYQAFKDSVDFDWEEQELRKFFERV